MTEKHVVTGLVGEGSTLVFSVFREGKQWPFELKLRDGNRVTKFG